MPCCRSISLLSFPTRRSSDLLGALKNGAAVVREHEPPLRVVEERRIVAAADRLVAANAIRSEEHTSELQSHSDLVCRLLLEKKHDLSVREPLMSEHQATTHWL